MQIPNNRKLTEPIRSPHLKTSQFQFHPNSNSDLGQRTPRSNRKGKKKERKTLSKRKQRKKIARERETFFTETKKREKHGDAARNGSGAHRGRGGVMAA